MTRTIIIWILLGCSFGVGTWLCIRPTLQWAQMDGTFIPAEPPMSRLAGLN